MQRNGERKRGLAPHSRNNEAIVAPVMLFVSQHQGARPGTCRRLSRGLLSQRSGTRRTAVRLLTLKRDNNHGLYRKTLQRPDVKSHDDVGSNSDSGLL